MKFYATYDDIVGVLEQFEAQNPVRYVTTRTTFVAVVDRPADDPLREALLRWLRESRDPTLLSTRVAVAIAPDADEGCAVCAAVIGKLEGPSAPPVVIPPASLAQFWQRFLAAAQVARGVVVVLPPSCGPPIVA